MSEKVGNAFVNIVPRLDEGVAHAASIKAGAEIGEDVSEGASQAMKSGMDNAGQVGAQ